MVSKDWPQIIPKVHIDKDTIILATKTDKQTKGTKKRPQNREHSCKDTIFWERVSAIYFRKKESIFNKWFLENIPFWHIHMPKKWNYICFPQFKTDQTFFLIYFLKHWNLQLTLRSYMNLRKKESRIHLVIGGRKEVQERSGTGWKVRRTKRDIGYMKLS